jgi:hypothetical protein
VLVDWPTPAVLHGRESKLGAGESATLSFLLQGKQIGQYTLLAQAEGDFNATPATANISVDNSPTPGRVVVQAPVVVSATAATPSIRVEGTDLVSITAKNRSSKPVAFYGFSVRLFGGLVLVKGSGRWGKSKAQPLDSGFPESLEWPTPAALYGTESTLAPGESATLSFLLQGKQIGDYGVVVSGEGRFNATPIVVPISVLKRLLAPKTSAMMVNCPSEVAVGQAAAISGRLSPPISGADITMNASGPAHAAQGYAANGSGGSFTWQFTPSAAGKWTVTASWVGNATHHAATATCTLTAALFASSLSLSCPQNMNPGQGASVQAQLTPTLGGVNIDFSTSGPGTVPAATVQTDANGVATHSFTFAQAGTWTVTAHWAGDSSHTAATGNCTITVNPLGQSSLAMDCPETAQTGEALTLTAALTPALEGQSIQWIATAPDGSKQSQTVPTDATATAYYNLTPSQAGNWSISAHWAGDASHNDTTGSCTIDVQAPSALTMNCPTNPLTPNSAATVTGTLTPAVNGSPISITYTPPANSGQQPTTDHSTTDETGYYADSFGENASGTWTVTATFTGDTTRDSATASCTFAVLSP